MKFSSLAGWGHGPLVGRPPSWAGHLRKWGVALSLLCFTGSALSAQNIINATSASVDWSDSSGWEGGAVPGEADVARFPSSLNRNNAVGPSVVRGMELAGWGSSVLLRSSPDSPLVLREHATHGPAMINVEHANIAFQIEPLSAGDPKRSALHVEGEANLTIGFIDFFHGHFGAPPAQAYGDTILNVQPVPGQDPEESAILLQGSIWQPSVTRGVFHLDGSRLSFLQEIDQTTGDTADHFHTFEGEIHGTGNVFATASWPQSLLWQGGASTYSGDSVLGNQVRVHLSAPNLLSPNSRWVFVDNFAQPGGHLVLNGHAQTVGGLEDPDGLGTLNTGGATLTVRETANGVYRGALAGGGSLIKTGGGRLLFEPHTANLDGSVEVREGVLAAPSPASWGDAAPVLSGGWLETAQTFTTNRPLTLADPGDRSHEGLANALLIPGGTTATWTGGLSGSGPLHKTGDGALHLSGGSTHSGLITVHEGNLHLAEEGLINSAAGLDLQGGTLHTGGFSQTFAILSGTEGTLNTGAGGTLLLSQSESSTFGGHLSGAATIRKTGAANLTLSRADQSGFTGGWRVDAGRLTLEAPGSIGGGSSALQLDGGELGFLGIGTFSRPVSLLAGGGGIHAGTEATEITWSGAISGEGGLTKSGPGLLYLTGSNTYTGLTTVAGGTLRGGPASFPVGMGDLHIAGGAVFDTGGHGPGMRLLSGPGTLLTGGGPVFINHQGDTHFEGVFSGGGRIVKDGEGVLALSGENEYPAETRVVHGTLRALADHTFSPDSLHEIFPQGTLDLNDHDQHLGGLIGSGPVTLGSARLTVADEEDHTFAGVISGEGGITKQGEGIWTLTQPQTFSGETRVEEGRLVLDGADRLAAGSPAHVGGGATLELRGAQTLSAVGGSGAVDLNGGSLILTPAEETSLGISLGGSGGLEINSPHRVTLTGVNTYTGLTNIVSGSLRLSPGGFPGGMAELSIGAEGTLELNGLSPTIASLSGTGSVSLAGGSMNLNQSVDTLFGGTLEGSGVFHKTGAGVLSLGGANTHTATTRVSNGVLRAVAANTFSAQSPHEITGTGILDLQDFDQTLPGLFGNGAVLMDGATLTVDDATDRSFTGTLSGQGTFRKTGVATLSLGGSGHDFDGEIRVENGVLALLSGTVFSAATRFHVAAGASLVLPDGDFALANLSGAGNVETPGGRFTVSTEDSREFTGNITGSDGLTKTGSGTLTLSGGNNWTSELRVEQGTLILQGTQTLPDDLPVLVAAGATLRIEGFTARIASLSGSGTVELDPQSTLHLAFDGNQTVTASLTGGGGLTVDGDGVLTLAAANTLDGPVTVANGTLRIGHADALSGTDALEVTEGATLDLNGHNLTLAHISGGGTVLTGDGTLVIHTDVHRVIQASLSGTGTLRKSGTGTLELTGDVSAFTGDLILETGLLRLPLAPELASLQFAGGTLALTQSQTLDFPVTAEAAGGVLLAENSAHLILDTPVGGPGALHLGGNGSFFLEQTATLSGGFVLSGGTLILHDTDTLGAPATPLTFQGGRVRATANLNLSRPVQINNNPSANQALVTVDAGAALTLSGPITGTGRFRKEGEGTLWFDGDATAPARLVANIQQGTLGFGENFANDAEPEIQANVGSATFVFTSDLAVRTTHQLGAWNAPDGEIRIVVYEGADVLLSAAPPFSESAVSFFVKDGPGSLTLNRITYFRGIELREGNLTLKEHINNFAKIENGRSLIINENTTLRLDISSVSNDPPPEFSMYPEDQDVKMVGDGTFDLGDNPNLFVRLGLSMQGETTLLDFGGVIEGTAARVYLPANVATLRGQNTFTAAIHALGSTMVPSHPANLGHPDNLLHMSNATIRPNTEGLFELPNPIFLPNPLSVYFEAAHPDAVVRLNGGILLPFPDGKINTLGPGRVEIASPITSPSNPVTVTVESGTLRFLEGSSADMVAFIVQPGAFLDLGPLDTFSWLTADSNDHTPLPEQLQLTHTHQSAFTFDPGNIDVLTLSGSGTVFLNHDNPFTGQLILRGGTVAVENEADLGDPTRPLVFDGGLLRVEGQGFNQITRSTEWLAGGGGIHVADPDHIFFFPDAITEGVLRKQGPGTLVLTGNNTHEGGTVIHEGALRFSGDHNLGGPGAPLSVLWGGLALDDSVEGTVIIDRPVDAWRQSWIHVPNAGQLLVFTHPIVDTNHLNILVKSGEGDAQLNRLWFGGTGEILVHQGKLYLESGDHYAGFLNATGDGRLHLMEGAILGTLAPDFFQENREITLPLEGPGGLRVTGPQDMLQKVLRPVVVMTYTGPTILEGGIFQIPGPWTIYPNGMGPLHLTGGARLSYFNGDLHVGPLSGGGEIGGSPFRLFVSQETDTFHGGRLTVAELIKYGAGTLTLAHPNNNPDSGIRIEGGAIASAGAAPLGINDTPILLNGGTLRILGTDFAQTPHPITLGQNGGGIDVAEAEHTFTLTQAFAGAGRLEKHGPGTLALDAEHTHSGGVTLHDGLLYVAEAASIGSGPVYFEGGAIHWADGRPEILGGIGGSGDWDFGPAPLRLEQQLDTTHTGSLTGGALTKAGPGTLTLAGDPNLSGPLTSEAGILTLPQGLVAFGHPLHIEANGRVDAAGALAAPVHNHGELRALPGTTPHFNGLLTGTGQFVGNHQLNGTTRPGASPGALTFHGDLTLGSGHQLEMDIAGTVPGTGHDTLIVHGDLHLDGDLTVLLDPGHTPQPGDTHALLQVTGSLSGTFTHQNLPILDPLLAWIHLHLPTDGTLSVAAANALFSGWIAQFEDLENPADRTPTANPSGDGVSNLLKYAFGMNPAAIDRSRLPLPLMFPHPLDGDKRLTLIIPLNPDAVGINLIPEASANLLEGSWIAGPEAVEIISQTPEELVVTDAAPDLRRFFRVRVELQEQP